MRSGDKVGITPAEAAEGIIGKRFLERYSSRPKANAGRHDHAPHMLTDPLYRGWKVSEPQADPEQPGWYALYAYLRKK